VISTMYTYHMMLEKQDEYGLTSDVIHSLDYIYLDEERQLQQHMYEEYVRGGCQFDLEDVLTSQALDYKMILYGEQYGWHNYEKVAKAFESQLSKKFNFIADGANATEQSTYIITALSVAFEQDFRSEFQHLNFPINDDLYEKWYSILTDYLYPPDTTPPVVHIVKPADGKIYLRDEDIRDYELTIILGAIHIEANATDEHAGNVGQSKIEKIEMYIDDELKAAPAEEPYNWLWDEYVIGWHTIKVVAYDDSGNTASDEQRIWIFNI
ncbi:MAG: Ig-like domain-containing protein, partial [Thermoplasmatota archaeon]